MSKFKLENLTMQEKIGQLLMVGFSSPEINDDIINLIKEYKVGNIILFARNYKDAKTLFKLNQDLQKVALEEIGIPLFISMDQEGGMVSKIYNEATIFPGAMTIGATNNYENAKVMGNIMGEELKAFGVNMNLAPIFDVNNNPHNPIIGSRSFSDKPEEVAKFATNFALGLQEKDVYSVAKHFPGHGNTHVDSHISLPTVTSNKEELDKVELYPFKFGVEKGLKGVMTTHIVFSELDNELPATMSKKILTNLLRDEIGFDGLIVSDGMEMKGIINHYDIEYATLEAINAGVNLALLCHPNQSHRRRTANYILDAVNKGEISEDLINERVNRVLREKNKLEEINTKRSFKEIEEIVINDAHKLASYNVVKDGFTLIKGENIKLSDKALFVGQKSSALTIASGNDGVISVSKEVKEHFPNLNVMTMENNPTEQEFETIMNMLKDHEQIILTSYNSNMHPKQLELIEKVNERHNNVYVIALRDPFDLFHIKNIKNYLSLYEYTPNSIKVLIEYLKGEVVPKGIPPIIYE